MDTFLVQVWMPADDLSRGDVLRGLVRHVVTGTETPFRCDEDVLILLRRGPKRSAAPKPSTTTWPPIKKRVSTVADGARSYLATQHQNVLASLLELYPDDVAAHLSGTAPAAEPALIAELVDIEVGRATWDERHREKQPDWSCDAEYSGRVPAERFRDHRAPQALEE